jgi:asparagine synthase (glutamine-hydrolysing)
MCGIAGLINLSGSHSREELLAMVSGMAARLSHRGPDDYGVWIDERAYCALAHRRLSIIDTSANGHQPMESENGDAVITYNGELYNYKEIRRQLQARGQTFRTDTDTEVFLKKLIYDGADALSSIDGMFALGLYNKKTQELLLARDPFGEKPLYYAQFNGLFAFSSEVTAIAGLPDFSAVVARESIEQYLLLQYIHAPRSIYRDIAKLQPGHVLKLSSQGGIQTSRYFQFSPAEIKTDQDLDDLADELEDILSRSIERRLMSDVPLGLFLSGGIDSSLVAALCAKKLGVHIQSFTIGFNDKEVSEHLEARAIAQFLQTDHKEKLFDENIAGMAATISRCLDEPNADTSCLPTYLLSQFARQNVTVALSGDGGDEMFWRWWR